MNGEQLRLIVDISKVLPIEPGRETSRSEIRTLKIRGEVFLATIESDPEEYIKKLGTFAIATSRSAQRRIEDYSVDEDEEGSEYIGTDEVIRGLFKAGLDEAIVLSNHTNAVLAEHPQYQGMVVDYLRADADNAVINKGVTDLARRMLRLKWLIELVYPQNDPDNGSSTLLETAS